MKKILIFILVVISILLFKNSILVAQDTIKKEVVVVKPYVPVVSDASKINSMPAFNDTTRLKPSFDYKIVPTAIPVDYQLSKINPARMVNQPLPKLYKTYLKLGIGNVGPLADVYFNSLRSKNFTAGAYLHHQSSGKSLKLDNSEKVFAGFSDNEAQVFGKKFFKRSYLYAEGGLLNNTVYQYGYDTSIDTLLEKGDIRQIVFVASAKAGFRSVHNDSSNLSYHFSVGYKYIRNRYEQAQSDLRVMGEGSQLYKKSLVGLHTHLTTIKPNSKLDSMKFGNTIFNLHPFFINSTSEYRIKLAADINFENQSDKLKFRIYPEVELSINIAKDVLIGYIGIEGHIKDYNYYDITAENPFIIPNLTVKNSYISNSSYGGIKGSLGLKASYNLKADFTQTKNEHLYVNDTLTLAQNMFNVVYDDIQKTTVTLETNYDVSKSVSFLLRANYYDYIPEKELKVWYKPQFDVTFTTRYNMQNKILLNLDILGRGKQYAFYNKSTNKVKELPGITDINVGVEYRYTKILSGWVQFNNILGTKYYNWNFYPNYRFNIMFGITYSL